MRVVTIQLTYNSLFTQLQKSRRNSKILSYTKQFLATTFRFIFTQPSIQYWYRSSNSCLLIPYKWSESVQLALLKGEVVPWLSLLSRFPSLYNISNVSKHFSGFVGSTDSDLFMSRKNVFCETHELKYLLCLAGSYRLWK